MRANQKIVVIGDSTIDNKVWVSPGVVRNFLPGLFRPRRDDTQTRIMKSKLPESEVELSVIENLIDLLPDYDIKDFTNDGFTARDVLIGAYRDKVFSTGGFLDNIFKCEMFPHTTLTPLFDGKDEISQANYLILSVGGNNVREFLLRVNREKSPQAKENLINNEFPKILDYLKRQYLEIVKELFNINANLKLILMTQYYPSFVQKNYRIYEFIAQLGNFLQMKDAAPADIIHELMIRTYKEVLAEATKKYPSKIIVADVTSTLNPFDAANHVCQIEPSGKGGKIIADLLRHIISCGDEAIGFSYCLNTEAENSYVSTKIDDWKPIHPDKFNYHKQDLAEEEASSECKIL